VCSSDLLKEYDLSHFKYLFLAGERLDTDTYHWANDLLQVPVIDHWWQTETGWAIAANCMGLEPLPIKPGSPTKEVPGYQLEILDDNGHILPPEKEGIVTIKLPLPPGTITTLWQSDQKYIESYLDSYPGYYVTGDGGYFDRDGYIYVTGRVDDVVKVAGHRLSTAAMEDVIAQHPDVAECAVIGMRDGYKGQLPLGLVVLKSGVIQSGDRIIKQLINMVREQIGAFASFKQALIVTRLPKTRSGKILRATLRKIASNEEYSVPSTIDDPTILDEIKELIKRSIRH
jgi:propionyl-CoA synthetase